MEKLLPKVTLVGAGPGDPDLITLKAIKALKAANVILYDALVNPAILDHAPAHTLKVFVGKRNGSHMNPQEDINKLCVHYAQKYGHVVRLKGGDPFVFGRGAEEVDYIQQYGVCTEVIPGISSAVAVPGSVGIPVTKRGVSESFWVITGTTSNGQLSADLHLAAQSTATLVVLMGTKKLGEIVDIYQRLGLGCTPVALIQSGTTTEEKVAAGIIDDIQAKAKDQRIGAPAVIVIGEVVKESPLLTQIYQQVILTHKYA